MYDFDAHIDRGESLKYHQATLERMYGTANLTPMWVADMDFAIMPEITAALLQTAHQPTYGYLPDSGLDLALINWFVTQYGVNLQSHWVHHAATLVQGFHLLLENFTQPEQGVIILSPVYMEFQKSIHQTRRKAIHLNLTYENHYSIDFEELERLAAFKSNTAMIFCNPHNPVGRVWTREELQRIVEICAKHDVLLISDEVHADLCYAPNTFTSLLEFEEIHSQLIVCYSPAKTFNLAAISPAFMLIPNAEMQQKYQACENKYSLTRISPFAIAALQVAFRHGKKWLAELLPYLQKNVQGAREILRNETAHARVVRTEGTYLLWIDLTSYPLKGAAMVRYLAKEAHIGVASGRLFGPTGDGFIRVNAALPWHELEDGIRRLAKALNEMPLSTDK